jgi:hypothetical protein
MKETGIQFNVYVFDLCVQDAALLWDLQIILYRYTHPHSLEYYTNCWYTQP